MSAKYAEVHVNYSWSLQLVLFFSLIIEPLLGRVVELPYFTNCHLSMYSLSSHFYFSNSNRLQSTGLYTGQSPGPFISRVILS